MPARPHPVAALVLPTVVPFDLGVAVQVFGYPRPDHGARRYALTLCTPHPGRVRTSGGFDVVIERGLEALRRARTIVVPGHDDTRMRVSDDVCRALAAAHRRGARILSICTGAFVLAESGLLDGRRATTHWLDAEEFATRFPRVALDPSVLYIDEGSVLTSAGISAGIDLCLHVVRQDHGAAVANAVARRLVVPPHREGGQSQYIARPVEAPSDGRLERTRTWMLSRLDAPLTVRSMSEHAGTSVRTFARWFQQETGTSPLRWLLRQRLLAAQELLESSDLDIEQVAGRCGFGTAASLRVHFRRELGTSPVAYRRSFKGAGRRGKD